MLHRWFALLFWTSTLFAALPADVQSALEAFHAEGPKGWSFTQTTTAEGRTLVERYEALKPEFLRWELIAQDGRTPSPEEAESYRQKFTRQSRGGTGPRLSQQIDVASATALTTTAEEITFTARFKSGEDGDRTADFLRAVFVWHIPSATIRSFTLESTGAFSPTLGVKIAEMRTTLLYSERTPDRPSLLQSVTTRLRGRAFFFKSLDADMSVTYTDYVPPPHSPLRRKGT